MEADSTFSIPSSTIVGITRSSCSSVITCSARITDYFLPQLPDPSERLQKYRYGPFKASAAIKSWATGCAIECCVVCDGGRVGMGFHNIFHHCDLSALFDRHFYAELQKARNESLSKNHIDGATHDRGSTPINGGEGSRLPHYWCGRVLNTGGPVCAAWIAVSGYFWVITPNHDNVRVLRKNCNGVPRKSIVVTGLCFVRCRPACIQLD